MENNEVNTELETESTDVELVFYEPIPTGDLIKQSLVGAAVGLAFTGVVYGVVAVGAYGVGKARHALDTRRRRKATKKMLAEAEANPQTEETE